MTSARRHPNLIPRQLDGFVPRTFHYFKPRIACSHLPLAATHLSSEPLLAAALQPAKPFLNPALGLGQKPPQSSHCQEHTQPKDGNYRYQKRIYHLPGGKRYLYLLTVHLCLLLQTTPTQANVLAHNLPKHPPHPITAKKSAAVGRFCGILLSVSVLLWSMR